MMSTDADRDEDIPSNDADSCSSTDVQEHESQSFFLYPSLPDLLHQFAAEAPMSGLLAIDQDNHHLRLYCCYRRQSLQMLQRFELGERQWHHGLCYHNLQPHVGEGNVEVEELELSEINAVAYCLILPLAVPVPAERGPKLYAVISSDCKAVDNTQALVSPHEMYHEALQ